jgi:hypothetical protein
VSFVIAAAVLSACTLNINDPEPPADSAALNILFVGNSLTYSNDLPGMVEALIDSAGLGPVEVQSVAEPNYGLEEHWFAGAAAQVIDFGGWDFVVLQQGPSATEGRPFLLEYTIRFDSLIRAVGAVPALYMVWPSFVRSGDWDGVHDSYRTAADTVGGLFLPAGEAWRVAWEQDATLQLYDVDGFHPSALGTYAAALVMVERFTGRSPVGLARRFRTSSGVVVDLPEETAALVQEAAREASARF